MKKMLVVACLVFVLPLLGNAHTDESNGNEGFMMMRGIEDSIVGDDLHQEMEGLMEKMIKGSLDEKEIERMSEIMKEYPAVNGMMMNRMMYSGNTYGYQNHMLQNWTNNFSGLMWFTHILFWIFLLMAIASFWKWLQR